MGYKYEVLPVVIAQRQSDINEHDEIGDDDCGDVAHAFSIDFVLNGSLRIES